MDIGNDVIIRFATPEYNGTVTLAPGPGEEVYDMAFQGNGKRTLQFKLKDEQFIPVDIPELELTIRLYRNKFEICKMKKETKYEKD